MSETCWGCKFLKKDISENRFICDGYYNFKGSIPFSQYCGFTNDDKSPKRIAECLYDNYYTYSKNAIHDPKESIEDVVPNKAFSVNTGHEFAQPYYEKKYDQGKLRYDLIPPEFLKALAEIFTYGLNKGYGEESWKDVPDANKRYTAAFFRHFEDWRNGNTIDEESGKQHLWHAFWNIGALVYLNKEE